MAFKKKKKLGLKPAADSSFSQVAGPRIQSVGKVDGRDTVNMDRRKLTKSQVTHLSDWRGAKQGVKIDDYTASMLLEGKNKFGAHGVMAGSEIANLLIGIPCPSLAFEYVIAQDVFPLSVIIQLVGKPKSNKSALLFELYRWFINAGGVGNYIENETKMSPDLLPSIVGYDQYHRVLIDFCDSVESWQQHIMHWITAHQKRLTGTEKEPGPGRTLPILLGVDSIMGKASYETQERVSEQGHGSRAFPVEAMAITQWLKTVPHMISGWPFTLILNNHLKIGKDDTGREERRTGGGTGTNFQESFELEMSVRKQHIQCSAWDGRVLNLKCVESSFGPSGRSIDTRLLWTTEPDPADPSRQRQVSIFDWHWATVKMLTSLQGREAAELKKVFHIVSLASSDVENSCWSSSMKVSSKSPISWGEMGALISQDADALDLIRNALGIKRRALLEGDYQAQLSTMADKLMP